jgi:hypothetical protein
VSIVTEPFAVGVQRYQIEAPPELPAWLGSPDSLVAPTVEPLVVPVVPEIACAFANMSFAGAAPWRAPTPVAHASATKSATSAVAHRSPTY